MVALSTKQFNMFYNIRPQNYVFEPSDVWVVFLNLCTIIIIIVVIVVTIVIMIITEMLLSASCNWK